MNFSDSSVAGDSDITMWSNETSSKIECDVCGLSVACDVQPNLFEFILAGILLNVINTLGIICNLISIFILSQKQMRVSINCCLVGLASFDIVLLLCSIFVWGIPAIGRYTGRFQHMTGVVIPRMTPWLYPLATIAHTGSTYATLTVTIERYVAVCHSLKARYICTYGRARLYMLLITIFVVLYNIPKFFEIELQPIFELPANVTRGLATYPTPLRHKQLYIEVYIMWMYLLVMYCVPFGALLVLNGLIYRNVRHANQMRQLLSRHQQKEIGLATMLFAIVLLFMACNSLSFVINIIEVLGIKSDSSVPEQIFERLADFSNLLVNINSSSNFIIYCIFGQKFRRLFLRIFCGWFDRGWMTEERASCVDGVNNGHSVLMKRLVTTPEPCCSLGNINTDTQSSQARKTRRDTTITRLSLVASTRYIDRSKIAH